MVIHTWFTYTHTYIRICPMYLYVGRVCIVSMYADFLACIVCVSLCTYVHTVCTVLTCTVLEIRSKCRMDKCPSIIIVGQTFSDLLGHLVGEVRMCHSRCASTNNESISRHSQYK